MSILSADMDTPIVYVGHMFDVNNRSYGGGFPTHYDNNNVAHRPDFSGLKGLLGFRNSHNAYVKAFEKYVVAAFITCYVSEDGIHVHDDRFNRIIRMVNKVYGLPMGTLNVEFDLKPGRLRMWHKGLNYGGWSSSIVDFDVRLPQAYGYKTTPYYSIKPQAIKTHIMAVERLLNYDIDNDILVNN